MFKYGSIMYNKILPYLNIVSMKMNETDMNTAMKRNNTMANAIETIKSEASTVTSVNLNYQFKLTLYARDNYVGVIITRSDI